MERQIRGIPASPGIVVGHVHLLRWEVPDVRHRIVPDEGVDAEIARFHATLARARERLHQLRGRVEATAGAEEAAIFDVQFVELIFLDKLVQLERIGVIEVEPLQAGDGLREGHA